MKMFNWVHRKFHHKEGCTGQDVKNDEFNAKETETETQVLLLQHTKLADALDGWREGILTIGTFGFDPLLVKGFTQKDECPVVEKEKKYLSDEEEEEEYYYYAVECNEVAEDDENESKGCDEEEVNPLVYSAFGCVSSDHYDENVPKTDHFMKMANVTGDEKGDKDKIRERTTLADLFSADSDHVINTERDRGRKLKSYSKKQPDLDVDVDVVLHSKKGLSFAKKLIPRLGEDTLPIKKLHKLMRRMLKRKIHPDIEGKLIQKQPTGETTTTTITSNHQIICEHVVAKGSYGANESVNSLLQSY